MQDVTKSRRLGRPPLPSEEVRSKRVVTFVTQDEYARLNSMAHADNKSISSLCHTMIGRSLQQAGPSSLEPDNELEQSGANQS